MISTCNDLYKLELTSIEIFKKKCLSLISLLFQELKVQFLVNVISDFTKYINLGGLLRF